jgi:diaminohydroxyphosphoribosylaminopyrimidine deaminase/5-amino-6-(5-phosphoribosylamino)uracil reductase
VNKNNGVAFRDDCSCPEPNSFWAHVASGPQLLVAPGGDGPPAGDNATNSWEAIPQLFRTSADRLPPPWEDIFEPLRIRTIDDIFVIGQIGQSLDGRIATTTGHSRYINQLAGLAHLHRLRALVDAVIVGVGSALADDPQLTVRRVSGPNPARVVLDPHGRLTPNARLLAEDGVRRVVVTTLEARRQLRGVEIVTLPALEGYIAPAAIIAGLAAIGLRRTLIEGGPDTLSRFLLAGCLDRLHVVVAPIILGDGRPGFSLGPIDRLDEALRPPMRIHSLGGEILFDCDFAASRRPPVAQVCTSTSPTRIDAQSAAK